MYSLGIILWEVVNRLITGRYERPYAEYTYIHFDFQIVIQAAKKGTRPSIPRGCPREYTPFNKHVARLTRCRAHLRIDHAAVESKPERAARHATIAGAAQTVDSVVHQQQGAVGCCG